jgi:hypothetical protein
MADRSSLPVEVMPPAPSPRNYWTRRGIAEWLVDVFFFTVVVVLLGDENAVANTARLLTVFA